MSPIEPPEKPAQSGSLLPLLLAGCAALLVGVTLLFLTLGFAGYALGIVAMLFAFVAFHYLVWGRWLSQSIRREVEAEDRRAAERAAAQGKSPTPTDGSAGERSR